MEGMCHDPMDSAAIRGTLTAVVFSRLVSFTRYRMFVKVILYFCQVCHFSPMLTAEMKAKRQGVHLETKGPEKETFTDENEDLF